ncbi:MAG: hypothetical protein P8Y23_17275 [Candidatus Lokiarchaeota archaeon]|jgi:hypothetical protein
MFKCNEILKLDDESIGTYFEDTPIDTFLEPILVKYPDYYNLRGQDFQQISDSERHEAFEILKFEVK